MHKIDSYLDKYDKKATYLSTENNLNFLKIKHLLDMKDGDVNVVVEYDGDMSKHVKININFSESAYEVLENKLICVYDLRNKLCIMRSKVMAPNMFIVPNSLPSFVDGFIFKIFDANDNYFSSLREPNQNRIDKHHLLYEKEIKLDRNLPDVVVNENEIDVIGTEDDPSSWFTMSEVFLSKVYQKMNITKNDILSQNFNINK